MLKVLALVATTLAGIVAVAALLLFSSAGGGDPTAAPVDVPRLALQGDTFDLGEVPADRTVERAIPFENPGRSPLEVSIEKVRPAPDAACGCGVDGYEVRPATVQPGGGGELVFMLRVPEGMPAMEDVMLAQLRTNDPDQPGVTISLRFRMSE